MRRERRAKERELQRTHSSAIKKLELPLEAHSRQMATRFAHEWPTEQHKPRRFQLAIKLAVQLVNVDIALPLNVRAEQGYGSVR
jgi:hypothetical protein